jgi:selenocysteine lyase/cysteine desulfurase
VVRNKARFYQEQAEAQPDPFIRYLYPKILDESRSAIAELLKVPVSTVVYVPNATTAVNTVLRNLVWNTDGKDEIFYFNTIYGACGKAVDYTCEASLDIVHARRIDLLYPISDSNLLSTFKDTISASRLAGHRPRLAVFDTVSSLPGVRMPFESLTKICAQEGILSLIDGAHGVGHLPLDLSTVDPDFFVSNLHKWLFVPRGCAIFYVPSRNQSLIRSTMPTSHGFVPRDPNSAFTNPLPSNNKSAFVANFEFVGTRDNSPYICAPEALKWRQEAAGGEDAIRDYCQMLVNEGSKRMAEMLGTEVMDNEEGTLTQCCMTNVRLPLMISHSLDNKTEIGEYIVKPGYGVQATDWMLDTMMNEFKTFLAIYYFQDAWWARMSGQIYLDMADFEWAGSVLKELCERAGKGEYLAAGKSVDEKRAIEGGDLAKDGTSANA